MQKKRPRYYKQVHLRPIKAISPSADSTAKQYPTILPCSTSAQEYLRKVIRFRIMMLQKKRLTQQIDGIHVTTFD